MNGSVLVAGASGLVGCAALRRFAALGGWRVRGISRRAPAAIEGVEFAAVDLSDRDATAAVVAGMRDVTHLVYAALHERPSLVAGWHDPLQMRTNQQMLENLFEPLERVASGLRHVTLLQGTKAYGAHLGAIRIPAREREPRVEHANFYWLQEDYLRERRAAGGGDGWTYTILRPQIVFGDALGVAMNPIPAIGAYAALLAARGEPLHYPGGPPIVLEAVDADLLAGAIAWAACAPAARDEIFNVTNGDVFVWPNVWPAIADALGMQPGDHRPLSLAESMPARAGEWEAIVRRHDLVAPDLMAFAGLGFQYADFVMAAGGPEALPPMLVSTVKLRAAGFHEVVDTEDMFVRWLHALQDQRLLPRP